MLKIFKKFYLLSFIFFPLLTSGMHDGRVQGPKPILSSSEQALVNHYNDNYSIDGYQFGYDHGGLLLFDENGVPLQGDKSNPLPPDLYAQRLKDLGIENTKYGSGGIDPFKIYSEYEYSITPAWRFMKSRNYRRISKNFPASGSSIISEFVQKIGADYNEQVRDWQDRWSERQAWFTQLLPDAIEAFKNPYLWALGFGIVVLILGVPLFIWRFFGFFFEYIFTRRPEILSDDKTNVFKSPWSRLFGKEEDLPTLILNDDLQLQLDDLISKNKRATEANRGTFFVDPVKTPYRSVLSFGPPATGKTLSIKTVANECGMNYMILSVGDLSQLSEEEACSTLKDYFEAAKSWQPMIFAIDEADRLLNKDDIKAQKLLQLFQTEFASTVNEGVQLWFITNYPEKFFEEDGTEHPMLTRLGTTLWYKEPTIYTVKKLLKAHLEHAKKFHQNCSFDTENIVYGLSKQDLEAINGRDVEKIAHDFCEGLLYTSFSLKEAIEAHKKQKEQRKSYAQRNKKEEEEVPPKEEPKKKSFWK